MSTKRSRNGCDQCRQRRRRCDEQKPTCAACASSGRDCQYTIKLRWGGREFKKSCFGKCLNPQTNNAKRVYSGNGDFVYGFQAEQKAWSESFDLIAANLPNGIAMPQKYSKLLNYFVKDVLGSLSCHESIHQGLCQSIVPRMLDCPHLLSAALALSAVGWSSRGLLELDGTSIKLITGHLQTSSLSLFRQALGQGQNNDQMLATCLMLCLADVYAGRQGDSSLQYHLHGAEALLKASKLEGSSSRSSDFSRSSSDYLYHLYLSLRILARTTSAAGADTSQSDALTKPDGSSADNFAFFPDPRIDGFLGFSTEDLFLLQQIEALMNTEGVSHNPFEAEALLRKVSVVINRDISGQLDIIIPSALDQRARRDFVLAHQAFQQAILIHIYRRLYGFSASSDNIQLAVKAVIASIEGMTQGQFHSAWVVVAMPLFTIGCEAITAEDKLFVIEQFRKLECCLGSAHIRVAKEALEALWKTRLERGDVEGHIPASQLLGELGFDIVAF